MSKVLTRSSFCVSAVAFKNQPSKTNKSSNHDNGSTTSGAAGGWIPEGELLLQVGDNQNPFFLFAFF